MVKRVTEMKAKKVTRITASGKGDKIKAKKVTKENKAKKVTKEKVIKVIKAKKVIKGKQGQKGDKGQKGDQGKRGKKGNDGMGLNEKSFKLTKPIIKATMSSVDHHPTPKNIPSILQNQHLLQRKNRIKTDTRLIGLSLRLHKVSVVKKVIKVKRVTKVYEGKKGAKGDRPKR